MTNPNYPTDFPTKHLKDPQLETTPLKDIFVPDFLLDNRKRKEDRIGFKTMIIFSIVLWYHRPKQGCLAKKTFLAEQARTTLPTFNYHLKILESKKYIFLLDKLIKINPDKLPPYYQRVIGE